MRLEHGGYRVGDGNVGSKMIDHEPIIPFAIRIVQNGLAVGDWGIAVTAIFPPCKAR
jgi:hypothetical protein